MTERINQLRVRSRRLKAETYALYLAMRHPQTPWYARILGVIVVAYAFSPIDLIPDFIPILGYLDDLILVPLGIAVVIRLIPPAVLEECRQVAAQAHERPTNRLAALVIVILWLLIAAWGISLFIRLLV